MKLIPRGRTKALIGLALVASSVAAVVPMSNLAQAQTGAPSAGPATLSPASGGLTGTFNLSLPAGASCPGDGPAGYRWGTYITPLTNDVGGMVFDGLGSPTLQPAFTSSLRESPGGGFVRGRTPGLTNGLIPVPLPTFQWLGVAPPAGAYNMGIMCTLNNGTAIVNTRYFNTQITVNEPTPGNFTFIVGVAPAPPVLTSSTYNAAATTATVNFTHAASDPVTTGYTATLVPVGAAAPIGPISVPAGATSFPIPGVALGSEYTVTLVATNTTGDSVPSNSLTVVGAVTAPAPVVNAPNAFVGTALTVSWTAPASGPAPASYDVAITPGGPSFTGVTGLSQVIPAGLATGPYTATVTPNYPVGSGVTGAAGSDTFSINPNALIFQEIEVTRPPGVLILTQRCGVFGELPAFGQFDGFPGFPRDLPLAAASADTVGTSPDIDLGTPGVQVDPEFGNYPFPQPATYPTECGLDMGTARFVTSGNLAGQFYTASGRLNQVTVLDTRDVDAGWDARGAVEDFASGADTFDGNYLGWTPVMTDDSDPVGGSTYDQLVTAGPPVFPGTGLPGAVPLPGFGTAGLKAGESLASASGGAGLGIATLDARMLLLIPASADAGDYTATLSLTVA